VENYRKQLLIGAVTVTVGSIMPWGKIDTIFGTRSINGTEGDGMITLVLGCILLLVGFMHTGTPGKLYSVVGVILALITLYVSGATMFRMAGAAAELSSDVASAGVGAGVFVTIIGSLVAAIGASKKVAASITETSVAIDVSDSSGNVTT
jgi:hypothetical protein